MIAIFLGIVGAAMGSFVGALTWRMHRHMNFVNARSQCEHCHHTLSALDLVPIISWLALRGRCRYCHKKIGATTLVLEIVTAAIFVLSFVYWPLGELSSAVGADAWQMTLFILWLAIVVLMMALLTYDYHWRLLPNRLMFPLIGLTFVFSITNTLIVQGNDLLYYLYSVALAMVPVAGVYGMIYILSGGDRSRLIGFGDVKFGLVVGLLFSWQGALLVLVMANVLGSLVTLPLLIGGKMKMNSQMAFGPFLISATIITFLFQIFLIKIATENLLLL